MIDMRKRFNRLAAEIRKLVVEQDAFGLKRPFTFNAYQFAFQADDKKMDAFKKWLQQQIDMGILEVSDYENNQPWTAKYIQASFQKGLKRAYTDASPQVIQSDSFYQGSEAQFLASSFNLPESMSKVQMLFTRAYDELEGVTSTMSVKMGRVLADGFLKGNGPEDIARDLVDEVEISKSRAEMIARTEVIRAHAEGQLEGFKVLGVDEVGIMVEWSTAGDDVVCEECEPLEGVVLTVEEAHGLIPRHPNCRCTYVPALKDQPEKGQVRILESIQSAFEKSLDAGNPDWGGKNIIE